MKKLSGMMGLFLFLAVVIAFTVFNHPNPPGHEKAIPEQTSLVAKLIRVQIPFIKNDGQINSEVSFYAQTFAGTTFVTKDGGMVYAIQKTEDRGQNDPASLKLRRDERGTVIKESLVGGKILEIKGEGESVTQVNSFIGNDPAKWQRNIATFGMVDMGEVYPGIGLKLKAYGKNVEKLFEVKPGASPEEIRVKLEGSKDLKVNEGGELVASTDAGDIKFTKPIAYQEIDGKRIEVEAAYKLEALGEQLSYGFKVGSYNKNHSLVIDPLLASTVVGGTGWDEATSIVIDSNNNVFVTGRTFSTVDPMQGSDNLYGDSFISKFDSTLSTLQTSTFFGGNDEDTALAMALDLNGNIYVTGKTKSSNFPTTTTLTVAGIDFRPATNDFYNVFISIFRNDLSAPIASTLLGGSSDDMGTAIVVGSIGEIYVAGETKSDNYPALAPDNTWNGDSDGFVAELSDDLSEILGSTYVGGPLKDTLQALAIGLEGEVYVAGYKTNGPNNFEVNRDIAIYKYTGDISELLASRIIGDNNQDEASAIAVDKSGNVFVAGTTWSAWIEASDQALLGGYDSAHNGSSDAIVFKFDGDLTATPLVGTLIGGGDLDSPESINPSLRDSLPALALGPNGEVYIAGSTVSTNYPTPTGSYDRKKSVNDYFDAFISKFDNNLTYLYSSTYLGGNNVDTVNAIAIASNGEVYVTGYSDSTTGFPITNGVKSLGKDVIIAQFSEGLSKVLDGPTSLNASALSSSSVVLSWKNSLANQLGLKIERKRGSCVGRGWSEIKRITTVNATTYRDNRQKLPNTQYSYRVRGYNAFGNSPYSNCKAVTTGSSDAPDAPDYVRAFSVGPTTVRVYWRDNSDDETHFKISRLTDGEGGSIVRPSQNLTNFAMTANGNRSTSVYSFVIKACSGPSSNAETCSPATNRAVVPFRPRDVKLEVGEFYGIDLTWADTSDNETGFQIQRKEGGCSVNSAWQMLTSTGINEEFYSDNHTMIAGTTYGYQIRSYTRSEAKPYAYGYSQWTQCVEETVPLPNP